MCWDKQGLWHVLVAGWRGGTHHRHLLEVCGVEGGVRGLHGVVHLQLLEHCGRQGAGEGMPDQLEGGGLLRAMVCVDGG